MYKSCVGTELCFCEVFVCFVHAGSNGKDFMFLLKGHEDLRQDERVMQLFGLVNTLLNNDPETFKRHLRYVVCIYVIAGSNVVLVVCHHFLI